MTVFNNSKYTRWYYSIINARLASPLGNKVYTESHHIIPESFHAVRSRPGPVGWVEGDPEAPTNKVSLSAREHFICHWLLTKMTTGKERFKMVEALLGMRAENKNQRRYKSAITSRVYAGLKHEHAVGLSDRFSGDGNPNWGNTWTDEQKQAQADKVRGEKNGAKQPAARKKIASSKRGKKRAPFSQSWLDALSAAHSGEGNGMYGKEHSDESKALQSAQAEKYGWVTDGTDNKRVLKTDIAGWLKRGWSVGRTIAATGSREKTKCPHCGDEAASNTYKRWHGDNCRHKT
jgi:hypothetical protein